MRKKKSIGLLTKRKEDTRECKASHAREKKSVKGPFQEKNYGGNRRPAKEKLIFDFIRRTNQGGTTESVARETEEGEFPRKKSGFSSPVSRGVMDY